MARTALARGAVLFGPRLLVPKHVDSSRMVAVLANWCVNTAVVAGISVVHPPEDRSAPQPAA